MVASVAIILSGPHMAEAAEAIADATGMGTTFVGTTLVAFCTSLPELVASVAAVRMGAYDLALGNIFGSNAFNMLLVLPIDVAYRGHLLANVSTHHAVTGLATIIVTAIAVAGQLYQQERRTRVLEPDAVLIIGLSISAMLLLYFLR